MTRWRTTALLLTGLLTLAACGEDRAVSPLPGAAPAPENSQPDPLAADPGGAEDLGLAPLPRSARARSRVRELYVDSARARERGAGTRRAPLASIQAALEKLPLVITQPVTIYLAPGHYATPGDPDQELETLQLDRSMRGEGRIRIIGSGPEFRGRASLGEVVLDWDGAFLVSATRGSWALESLQIGSNRGGQRGGVDVVGPAVVELLDVRIRTGSLLGAGILARHGGRVHLGGEILLNEHMRYAAATPDTFCRIRAEYGGAVRFTSRRGASLTLGNGSLDASYYGVIELGCEEASVTSWSDRWNVIAVNNSGRVDLHGTTLRVAAQDARNTPIGLEHDGHLLGEGAHIILEGHGNSQGIVLQKSSSLYCTDVEIQGDFPTALVAMSGSNLVVGVDGDLRGVSASTGATIVVEELTGKLLGPVKESKAGRVIVPPQREQRTSHQPRHGRVRG